MYYKSYYIYCEYGEYAATLDGELVATAPSKDELFYLLDNLVSYRGTPEAK